jgi:hypothetical protein
MTILECDKCNNKGIFKYSDEHLCSECLERHTETEEFKRIPGIKLCEYKDCEKRASYGYKILLRCKSHILLNMIDLAHKSSKCNDCDIRASFGYPGTKKKIACTMHKTDDMVDLLNKMCKKCKLENKNNIAIYGFPNIKKRIACKNHKTSDMIDLAHIFQYCKKCKDENKKDTQATFGYPNDQIKISCAKHKTNDMIDLVHQSDMCGKCKQEDKDTRASFGYPNDQIKISCAKHKTNDMIDLLNHEKMCEQCKSEGNIIQSSFGLPNTNKIISCAKHATANMVDLRNKTNMCIECKTTGDIKRASFGYITDKKKISCKKHKTKNMIDLVHKLCHVCNNRACYGKYFESLNSCKLHKLSNEISNNNPKCESCKRKSPFYSHDYIPRRCENCKLDDDINIIEKDCISCGLPNFIPDDEDKCSDCSNYKKSSRHLKEDEIKNLLSANFPKQFVHDKIVEDGCTKFRPDFLFTLTFSLFQIVVEVDEFQHSKYACGVEGEIRRMINIFEEDLGGATTIFIRYNPDDYLVEEKVKKVSNKIKQKLLIETIKSVKNMKETNHDLSVIYLYYDEYKKTEILPIEYKMKKDYLKVIHKHPLSEEEILKLKY